MSHRRRAAWIPCLVAGLAVAGLCTGCNFFGLFAYVLPGATLPADYKGLAKQRVAVMVWTDRATAIDWPRLQLDLARGIEGRLEAQAQKKDHPKELEGTTFAMPESVVRFQRDHPETEMQSITDVAPRLDVTRLIYIEIERFATRPDQSMDLFRGSITANVKVLEIADGKAKTAFQRDDVQLNYPEKAPEEGLPGMNDPDIYEKTLQAFAEQTVNYFVPHEPKDEDR